MFKATRCLLSLTAAALTARPLVFHWNVGFLDALCLLALAVVAVGLAVSTADGFVGAVTLNGLTGAAGRGFAVKAYSVVFTFLLALVCQKINKTEKPSA